MCPLECYSLYYNSFISYSDFPTPYYMNVTGKNSTDIETFKKSLLILIL